MTSEAFEFVFVDDEPDIRDIYEVFLSSLFGEELKFEFFLNGEECLKYLEKHEMQRKHFLIISDINMPKMDGFTLLKNISNDYICGLDNTIILPFVGGLNSTSVVTNLTILFSKLARTIASSPNIS